MSARTAHLVLARNDGEGALEIGADVVGVFDTHREAHQAVLDAERGALLRRETVVAHDGGLFDERLDTAERGRDGGELARVERARGRFEIGAQDEADDAAEAREKAL